MKQVIHDYVTTELVDGRIYANLSDDDDLLTSGLVDSLGMMSLVAFIEERFGIAVPPEDVTLETFSTIEAIATYLESRQVEKA